MESNKQNKSVRKKIPLLTVLMALGMVVLIIQNVMAMGRIDQLNNEMSNIRHQISQTGNDLRSLQYDIAEDLKEDDLISTYTIEPIEKSDGMIDMAVNVSMNRMEKGAKVYLTYKESMPMNKGSLKRVGGFDREPDNQWKSIEMMEAEKGIYSITVVGDKAFRYDFRLTVEGTETQQTQELRSMDFEYKFFPIVDGQVHMQSVTSTGTVEYQGNVFVDSENKLQIESAVCELVYNGEVVDSFDLMGEEDQLTNVHSDRYDAWGERTYEHGGDEEIGPDDFTYRMTVSLDDGSVYEGEWNY